MTWCTFLAEHTPKLGESAFDLLEEFVALRRDNHLHRDACKFDLELHKQNTEAALAHHQAEIKLANVLHDREIKQEHLMHEEEIDLEKRGALRENVRDVWMQLCDQAETVFVVNTLVLGVAFGMLAEAALPESITLDMPLVMVLYFCSLSAAISCLLASVRFAMILRLSVGERVTQLLRESIKDAQESEKQFRQFSKDYEDWYSIKYKNVVEPYIEKEPITFKRSRVWCPHCKERWATHHGEEGNHRVKQLVEIGPDTPAEWKGVPETSKEWSVSSATGGDKGVTINFRKEPKCNHPVVFGLPGTSIDYYEATFPQLNGSVRLGFAMDSFCHDVEHDVGDGSSSWCAFYVQWWHGSFVPYLRSWGCRHNGHGIKRTEWPWLSGGGGNSITIGVAASKRHGKIAMQMAGGWEIVSMSDEIKKGVYPILSCQMFDGNAFEVELTFPTQPLDSLVDIPWDNDPILHRDRDPVDFMGPAMENDRDMKKQEFSDLGWLNTLGGCRSWQLVPENTFLGSTGAAGAITRGMTTNFSDDPVGISSLATGHSPHRKYGRLEQQIELGNALIFALCKQRKRWNRWNCARGSSGEKTYSITIQTNPPRKSNLFLDQVKRPEPVSVTMADNRRDDRTSQNPSSSEQENTFDAIYNRLKQGSRQDENLQDFYQEIRDLHYKPWSECAQGLFWDGARFLLVASCSLVFGRFGYEKSPIPDGALAYPASPLSVWGFCVPVTITSCILVGMHWHGKRCNDLIKAEVILNRFCENLETMISEHREQSHLKNIEKEFINQGVELEDYDIAGVLKRNFEKMLPEYLDRESSSIGFEGTTLQIWYAIRGIVVFMTLVFVILALVLGPPSMPLEQDSVAESGTHAEGSSLLELRTLQISEEDGIPWPAFWEPTGATFWASQSSLLIVGGNTLVWLDVKNMQNAHISSTHQLPSSMLLSDACMTSGPRGDELWLAHRSHMLRLELNSIANMIQHNLSVPSAVVGEIVESELANDQDLHKIALDCRDSTEDDSGSYFWLAEDRGEFWPELHGSLVKDPLVHGFRKHFGFSEKWPTSWLLMNPNITAMLRKECTSPSAELSENRVSFGVLIDGIAMFDTRLLLLLTPTCSDVLATQLRKATRQLLVSINSVGEVHWWRTIAFAAGEAPGGQPTSKGVHWQAITADVGYRHVFLVSGGPSPQVAYTQMPFM